MYVHLFGTLCNKLMRFNCFLVLKRNNSVLKSCASICLRVNAALYTKELFLELALKICKDSAPQSNLRFCICLLTNYRKN